MVHFSLKLVVLATVIGCVSTDEEWTESLRSIREREALGEPFEIRYYKDPQSRQKRQVASSAAIPDLKLGPANGKPMRVVTILAEPYTMYNGQQMIGFMPDLFRIIGHRENIRFTMYHVKDSKYGYKKQDGKWTGMIGDLLARENSKDDKDDTGADIIGAPLTMSAAREEFIDYLNPFKSLGLVMVVKKIDKEEYMPVNFAVTDPLATEVWLICTAAVVVVGLVLFAINHFNPYEWSGRYDLGRATELHSESFNLSGSLWFAFTTFQWQGYERAPRSIASRILSVFWFTFISITMITYTASVVNYLFWASTVHGKDYTTPPILDLEHLVMSNQYKYGCVNGGSTYSYLTDVRRGEVFAKIKAYLEDEDNKDDLVDSTSAGFARVRKEKNYVFINEEPTAIHEINKLPCNLAISGKPFGKRSYSMGHRNNLSNVTVDQLHTAVLEMLEDGTIDALENKWFVDKGQCWNVTRIERLTAQQTALNLNKPKKKKVPTATLR